MPRQELLPGDAVSLAGADDQFLAVGVVHAPLARLAKICESAKKGNGLSRFFAAQGTNCFANATSADGKTPRKSCTANRSSHLLFFRGLYLARAGFARWHAMNPTRQPAVCDSPNS